MLGGLFRGNIGQFVAPDPKHTPNKESQGTQAFTIGLWNILAPDPNFTDGSPPPPPSSSSSSTKSTNNPTSLPTTPNPPTKTPQTTTTTTPTHPHLPPSNTVLDRLVLSAAKDLATSMNSPPAVLDDHRKFFNYCASSTALPEKKLKSVRRMLRKNPELAVARATKLGSLVPDGFTPLMTCAYVGNCDVAGILIDFEVEVEVDGDGRGGGGVKHDASSPPPSNQTTTTTKRTYRPISLNARDIQGRTALHIASEQGHVPMVRLLKSSMAARSPSGTQPIGPDAPTDLTGRTPMGSAESSREPGARRNRGVLREELFSPGDVSVFGRKTPARVRAGGGDGGRGRDGRRGGLRFGFSEMPGLRIEMEDAMCFVYPLVPPGGGGEGEGVGEVGFFGVFDGHGDGGVASQYVADNIVRCFTETEEWKRYIGGMDSLAKAMTKSCRDIDVDLKAVMSDKNRKGGTTGVMAVVTSDTVLVGNVGDSRCILVKRGDDAKSEAGGGGGGDSDDKAIEEGMSEMVIDDKTSRGPMEKNKVQAVPLSIDHNPDLPEEKKRVEKAGLTVVSDTYQEGESTLTVWKVQKSEGEKIAMSRAFGDFDYKANDEFSPEEQAIVSTPDIQVHKRDYVNDMYLVLACDGVWDVMSNDDVAQFVSNEVNELLTEPEVDIRGTSTVLPEVGDKLLKKCLDLGSSDNMSVLILAFPSAMSHHNDVPRALDFTEL